MKLFLLLLSTAATAIIICTPTAVSGQQNTAILERPGANAASSSFRSLAPSQRDINIAILAVIVGNLLIGYERAAARQRYQNQESALDGDGQPAHHRNQH